MRKKFLIPVILMSCALVMSACGSENTTPVEETVVVEETEAPVVETPEVEETIDSEIEEVIELSEEYLVDYPFNNNIYVKLAPGTSFNPENTTGMFSDMTNLDKYENNVIFVDIDNSDGYYTYSYNSITDANYYVAYGETEDFLTYEIINVEECENGFTISTVRETVEETDYTQASVSDIYILEYKIDESNKITLQLMDANQSSEYLDFYRTTENPVVVVK